MTANQLLVSQGFNPREAVRIGPHRVIDAGEVSIEPAASFLEKVREQKRHLVHGERELARPGLFIPHLRMRRRVDRFGYKLVPGIREDAALGRYRAEQR